MIVMARETDLLQVVHTLGAPGGFAGGLDRGEQESNEDTDDRNNDQQFNQSKTWLAWTPVAKIGDHFMSFHFRFVGEPRQPPSQRQVNLCLAMPIMAGISSTSDDGSGTDSCKKSIPASEPPTATKALFHWPKSLKFT